MKPSTKSRQSGFTLVEMLVALVIFALLSAAGVTVLRASVDTQGAIDRRLAHIGELGRLHALLWSDLAQVVDRPTRAESGDRPAFAGDKGEMQFVRAGRTNLDQQPRSDLQRVEWRFADDSLKRTGFENLDGADDVSRGAAFARNLADVTIRYRMPDGGWSQSFRSSEQAALPAAVEVTLAPAQGAPVTMVFVLPQLGPAPPEPRP